MLAEDDGTTFSVMLAPLILALTASVSPVPPGEWEVRSTVVELTVPGVPGFIQRMAKGKTKSERKRLAAGQGVEALLAPDPKAQCRINSELVADGRYTQALTCPQKRGAPMQITRVGTYDATGFAGRATVAGFTPKGPIAIIVDQRAVRTGG